MPSPSDDVVTIGGDLVIYGETLSSGRVYAVNGVAVGTALVLSGTGSPEGIVAAPVGSQWMRTDGAVGTAFYVKSSGSGTTGWIALQTLTAGTWTPVLEINGSTVGITYSPIGQLGNWVQIGGLLQVWLYIKLTSKGASVGALTVSGLPVTLSSVPFGAMPSSIAIGASTAEPIAFRGVPSTSKLAIGNYLPAPTNLFTDLTDANISNGFEIMAFGSFRTF